MYDAQLLAGTAAKKLRIAVERIERLRAGRNEVSAQIREVYSGALRAIISRWKRGAVGLAEQEARNRLLDVNSKPGTTVFRLTSVPPAKSPGGGCCVCARLPLDSRNRLAYGGLNADIRGAGT